MNRLSRCALALALVLPLAAGADTFDDAMTALREGDPGRGAVLFHELAGSGDGTAMYNLALLYHHGIGVPQNADLALYWAWRARFLAVPKGVELVQTLGTRLSAPRREALHERLIGELRAEADAATAEVAGKIFFQLALVEMGLRPKPDLLQAYVWCSLATALGQRAAAGPRDAVLAALKPKVAESAETEALAAFRSWCEAKGASSPGVCSVVLAGG